MVNTEYRGGEIIIPKLKSYRILDLVKAINDKCKIKYIGKRPGEKLNEEMISADDSSLKIDIGKFYVLVPSYKKFFSKFIKKFKENIYQVILNISQDKKIL